MEETQVAETWRSSPGCVCDLRHDGAPSWRPTRWRRNQSGWRATKRPPHAGRIKARLSGLLATHLCYSVISHEIALFRCNYSLIGTARHRNGAHRHQGPTHRHVMLSALLLVSSSSAHVSLVPNYGAASGGYFQTSIKVTAALHHPRAACTVAHPPHPSRPLVRRSPTATPEGTRRR